jgi:putative restriction endonuclease
VARQFGEIAEIPAGTTFTNRPELADSGVHRPLQAGISGGEKEGADSIVVSGGYEDEDYGDVLLYTGHGGNDPDTHRQVADQSLTAGNLALARSGIEGLPVRVVRGFGGDPAFSPPTGFRYDGVYRVESYEEKTGKSGFKII